MSKLPLLEQRMKEKIQQAKASIHPTHNRMYLESLCIQIGTPLTKENQQWEEKGWSTSLQIRAIRIHSAGLRLEISSRKDNALIMTRKSTVICFWKQPKQYWDTSVLIGRCMVTLQGKTGNGGAN